MLFKRGRKVLDHGVHAVRLALASSPVVGLVAAGLSCGYREYVGGMQIADSCVAAAKNPPTA